MNKEHWPRTIDCPNCHDGHQLAPGNAGSKTVCRNCGRSFHLLPDSQSEDTLVYVFPRAEELLPSVGNLWLDLRPGQIVAEKYLVIRPLGLGGLSRILQVRNLEDRQVLALKIPLASSLERFSPLIFFDEAEAWLKPAPHPNLVRCEKVEIIMGLPAIFMEYVPGGDLSAMIDEGRGPLYKSEAALEPETRPRPVMDHRGNGTLPQLDQSGSLASRILDIAIQLARGLAYAHSLGLSGLDIKPKNILAGRGGRILIGDYGPLSGLHLKATPTPAEPGSQTALKAPSSRSAPSASFASQSVRSRVLGTRQYFSPETAQGRPGAGIGADLWAASLTVLECFLGRRLWEVGSAVAGRAFESFLEHSETPPLRPIPDPVRNFLKKALAEEPALRHQSAREMEEDLTGIYEHINQRAYGRPAPLIREESPERLKMKEETAAKLAQGRKSYE